MKILLIYLILLINYGLLLGQKTIDNYDKICYCSGRETPHSIISYDNNLQLILALRNGLTKNGLDSLNIPYTESQLKLLNNYSLIHRDNEIYYTSIPVLDSVQSIQIRKQSKHIPESTLPLIEKDIEDFVIFLKTEFNTNHEFAILFSYILDGLTWKEFEKKGIISSRDSDDDTPFWTGQFWMIANPRKGTCGTNTSSENNATIFIANGVPWRFLKPLYDEYEYLKMALIDIGNSGKITSLGIVEHFEKYHLFKEDGDILVPVIYENEQNELYQHASEITINLCSAILKYVSLPSLVKDYGFVDTEQALIVFYHEIMWDLLTNMEEKEIIVKPKILKSSRDAELNDMADLIFFTIEN